jgi:hypothetical protein
MKDLPIADAEKLYDDLLGIDLDAITPVTNERVYLDTFAKLIRPWLKSLGFSNRRIGVVVPNYSMVMMIEINVPTANFYACYGVDNVRDFKALDERQKVEGYERYDAIRQKRYDAISHLCGAIDVAFPKNYDRSDSMTDYFDATYTIH